MRQRTSPFCQCQATGYSLPVKLRNFLHNGPKRLYTEGSAKSVPPDTVHADELQMFAAWKVHTPAGLFVTDAAKALQVSRPALSSLLNSRADLSGDMALRIEKAFGVNMDTLMSHVNTFYPVVGARFTGERRRAGECAGPGFPSHPWGLRDVVSRLHPHVTHHVT